MTEITLHGQVFFKTNKVSGNGLMYTDGELFIVVREDGAVKLNVGGRIKTGLEFMKDPLLCQIYFVADESKYDLTGYKLLD